MTLAGDTQLQRDMSITEPVALALAESITKSKAARAKGAPVAADLAAMITGVGEALTMQGAPQIQISLEDEEFALLESGFWGADPKTGKLDEIELNYPDGSKYWWRLRQVSPKADFTVQTYWIPSVVRKLMDLKGPLKAARASRTRAEFLKMLADHVPGARFHSKQLDIKQPIANPKKPKDAKEPPSDTAKKVGLTSASTKGLTVKGSNMTAGQRDTAAVLLQVCDRASAGHVATVAMIYAAIWESGLDPHSNNGSYWGALSASVNAFKQNDTVGMAEAFLNGGKGFTSAKKLEQTNGNPAAVASQAEGAIPFDSNGVSQQYHGESGYPGDAAAVKEAEAIVEAGGGASGAGGIEPSSATYERVQQYNYEVGSQEEPHEDFWTAMNRLAQEVNWELVVDGPDIYYDSDITLCRMALADLIERSDDNVVDWDYDWDERMIATNFVIVLVCGEFAFKPADVVKVEGFGPATEGSTIGLPGRWLVGEAQRNPGDIVATLTLVQPTRPLKEPAPKEEQTSLSPGEGDESGSHALPLPKKYMSPLGRTDDGVDIENAPDGTAVYSMTNGVCTAVASDPKGFGPNYPVIEVTEGERKGKFIYYGHVAKSLVKPGDPVAARQPIAVVGHTGDAEGLGHGHIEIGFCDRNGTPLSQGGSESQSGKEMREYIVWLCSMFGVKVS